MRFGIDKHEIDRLVVDLGGAGLRSVPLVVRAAHELGVEIREDARDHAPRTGLPHYAERITHEVHPGLGYVDVIVGPERGDQGSLGHILEYGTSRTPPRPHLGPARDRAMPHAADLLAEVGRDAL